MATLPARKSSDAAAMGCRMRSRLNIASYHCRASSASGVSIAAFLPSLERLSPLNWRRCPVKASPAQELTA